MSLLAAAFPALRRRVGRAFGASVGVHASIPTELRDASGGLVTDLEAAADAAIGDLTLSLRLADSARLTGHVPAGLVLTVGAAELQVAQLARADASLLSVALTEQLAVAITEGDPVTLATSAEFTLGDAIEQTHRMDPMRDYGGVTPSGELQIPLTGASPHFRARQGMVLLVGRPELPYADPDESDDVSPAVTAERVQIAAVLLETPDVVCVAYGRG